MTNPAAELVKKEIMETSLVGEAVWPGDLLTNSAALLVKERTLVTGPAALLVKKKTLATAPTAVPAESEYGLTGPAVALVKEHP